ncbi:MAG: hypothetical protein WAV18_18985 [Roseiarcus sp.]
MPNSVLNGDWTYRSFVNNPVPVNGDAQKALLLIFGEGDLSFDFLSATSRRADGKARKRTGSLLMT